MDTKEADETRAINAHVVAMNKCCPNHILAPMPAVPIPNAEDVAIPI